MNDLEKVPNIDNEEEKKINDENRKIVEKENNDYIEKLIDDHDKFLENNDEEFFTTDEKLNINNKHTTNTDNYKININNENINILKNDEVVDHNNIDNLKVDDKVTITFKNGQIINSKSNNDEVINLVKEEPINILNIDVPKTNIEEPIILPVEEPIVLPTEEPINIPNIDAPKTNIEEPIVLPTEEPIVLPTEEQIDAPKTNIEESIVLPTEEPINIPNIDIPKTNIEEPIILPTEEPISIPNIDAPKANIEGPIVLPVEKPIVLPIVLPINIPNIDAPKTNIEEPIVLTKEELNSSINKDIVVPIVKDSNIIDNNVDKLADIKDIKALNNEEIKDIQNRIVILKKLANCLIHNQELIYQAYKKDTGKHEFDFLAIEFNKVIREIKFFVKKLKSLISKRYFIFSFINFGSKVKLNYEPYGRVFIIAPFNYPFYLALLPMIGALAAGNTVILKLSNKSPALHEILNNYLSQILSPQIFTMIDNNSTPEQIENIISHSVDLLFFTGSTKVGLILNEICAKYNVKTILELGGANPVILLEDANIAKFAKKIIWAKLFNTAQTCIGPNHIYINENKLEKFLTYLKTELDKQLNDKIIAQLPFQQFLKNSSEGLSLYFEKDINTNLKFIVIKSEAQDKEVLNENFNTILPIVTYRDNNDLITKIKYLKDPLVTYFFTKDFKNPVIKQINGSLRSGSVVFNDFINFLYQNNIPFGGIGLSGSGKYQQKYSLEAFSYLRLYFYKNGLFTSKIVYFPDNDKKMKKVNKIYKYKKYKNF